MVGGEFSVTNAFDVEEVNPLNRLVGWHRRGNAVVVCSAALLYLPRQLLVRSRCGKCVDLDWWSVRFDHSRTGIITLLLVVTVVAAVAQGELVRFVTATEFDRTICDLFHKVLEVDHVYPAARCVGWCRGWYAVVVRTLNDNFFP